MRDAHAAAVAALRDGDRVGLVTALGAMAVPAEDDVAEFAGVLLSLDESGSRERLLRIAALNTRDSEQWRLLQLVPEIGVLWPPPLAVTTPGSAEPATPGSGELSRLLGFLDRPSRERTDQAAPTVQALAGMNRAMRLGTLEDMGREDLEPVVERALMSGNREVANAVWLRWRQLADPEGPPLQADVIEHLDAVAAELRRQVETWQAERVEQAVARLRDSRPSDPSQQHRDPQLARPTPPLAAEQPAAAADKAAATDNATVTDGGVEAAASEGPPIPVALPEVDRAAPRFAPLSQDDLAPSGAVTRVRANLAALRTVGTLQAEGRRAGPAEQAVLARWSGWGAVPEALDERREDFAWARAELGQLLSPAELRAAARNTLNAHYTDLSLVAPIWEAVARLGFTEGPVLEPGCGSGNFIAAAPPGAQMVGVELEPMTAAVAAYLYPDAQILAESFAATRAPRGSFHLVVGNVPFAKVALRDKDFNPAGHTIHNHFILKSLQLTAPGGLVAVLTSRYTLDAVNPAARREMAQLADLVGAVRLPENAHQRAAGTRVVTDLLVFRRREADYEPADNTETWEQTRLVEIDGHEIRVNGWFVDHPELVCGQLGVGRGQYQDGDLTVRADRPAADLLREALDVVVTRAVDAGLTHAPSASPAPRAALVGQSANRAPGYLAGAATGGFTQLVDGVAQPYSPPATQAAELRALLELRDTVVSLLEAEAASLDSTPEIDRLRHQLNTRYDAYSRRYGPLNRFTARSTGKLDPETGEVRMARIRPPQGGFRADPHAPLVYALEHFDPSTQTAHKADVFTERVVARRLPPLGADSPADALAICVDQHGRVDLDVIAGLLGVDRAAARTGLGDLVFDDPMRIVSPDVEHPFPLLTAAEYLSGNVRVKLQQAQQVAEHDPRFARNVEALTAVIPDDIPREDIVVRLGAAWIDAPYVQQFLREILDDDTLRVEHPFGAMWTIKGRDYGVAATTTWGTEDICAPTLAQLMATQSEIVVRDTIIVDLPDGGTSERHPVNVNKTIAAQAKADEMAARFADWLWEDPARAADLHRTYNDRFNAMVARSYDGIELSLPGLALTAFKPKPHQYAAVARMIAEPAVGLFHEVGAGKTFEMIAGIMEQRRLGLIRKSGVCVPNHMLEQFAREWQQLYPRAKLLLATSQDLTKDRRRAFIARVATGDWDAVLLTRTAFEKIAMSPQAQADYLDAQVGELRAAIERARSANDNQLSLKRMERALQAAEERIKTKLDTDHDPALTFEMSGIDYVVVDEAHAYKNLRTVSNVSDVAIDGSNRASDLEMKLHYLRGRYGGRVGTFATATPIANKLSEAWVMMRYLRPDLLEAAGVSDIDAWLATFAQSVSAIELGPAGGFRIKSRIAKFHNLPEMLQMWLVAGDVKTAQDLNLDVPQMLPRGSDGARAPETVVVPPTTEQVDYVATLGQRADDVRSRKVKPDEDNMLAISNDGRAAALDPRLVGLPAPDPGEGKLAVVAAQVVRFWEAHRDDVFGDKSGRPHPVPGAVQVVFCDLSTPNATRWNAYDELRDLIAAGGVPREQIRFIHEASTDQKKAELFAACRDGRVAVLLGSTEKMGVGTNIQDRLGALHDVDCPWRPADLAQRLGRIIRQGNQFTEVAVFRYVTEATFDAYMWQAVTRKATFIAQAMRGNLDMREMEDIGDAALNANEVKALATGDPLILDKAQADADLNRLERLNRAHDQTRSRLRDTIRRHERGIEGYTAENDALQRAIEQRTETRGDAFTCMVRPSTSATEYNERIPSGEALREMLRNRMGDNGPGRDEIGPDEIGPVIVLGNHTFHATVRREKVRGGVFVECALQVPQVPHTELKLSRRDLTDDSVARGLIVRLENRLHGLDKHREDNLTTIDQLHREIEQAREQLTQPFAQEQALQEAQAAVAEVDARMAGRAARDEMTPAQRALHELAERAYPLIADQQDATAAGRVMLAIVAADRTAEMEAVRRSARDMLITVTREHPALSGWRAIPPEGEPLPRGVTRDDLAARCAAMDRMAAVLEILDVTAPLVRDREMTLPAGLRQFAAGARAALAGGPAPTGPLATATPEAPNTALTSREPTPITTTRDTPAAEIPLPAGPPAETTPTLPAADPAPAAPDTAAAPATAAADTGDRVEREQAESAEPAEPARDGTVHLSPPPVRADQPPEAQPAEPVDQTAQRHAQLLAGLSDTAAAVFVGRMSHDDLLGLETHYARLRRRVPLSGEPRGRHKLVIDELNGRAEAEASDATPGPTRRDPVADDAARMAAAAEGTGVDVAWAAGESTYALLHRAAYDVLHRNPQRTTDPRQELIDGLRRLGIDEDHLDRIADGAVQNPARIVEMAIRAAQQRISYRERGHIMSPVEFVQLDAREQLDVVDQLARMGANADDVDYLLGQCSAEQLQPLREHLSDWPAEDPLRQLVYAGAPTPPASPAAQPPTPADRITSTSPSAAAAARPAPSEQTAAALATPVTVPDLATRADVVTYIAGTGRGGRGAVDAFLRLHRGPDGYDLLDAAQQRMGLAAIAGRGRNSLEFDARRAQRALQRLADADPSLPANAVGQRVTLTERDPTDTTIRIRGGVAEPPRTRPVTGQVVSIRPGPGPTVQVVIDRDGGPDQGDTPRAVQDVPADVELTMAPPRPAAAGAPARPDRPQQTAALDGAEASSGAVDTTAAAVGERLVDGVVQSHIPGLPRMVMVAGRAVLVRGVDDGTVLVYDPDTQQAAAVPWERVMVSTASATRPIRIRLTEPQADELTVRVNDMFDGDPVRDASYGMRVRFRSWLDVHDPAAALSELDNALDIITDNLRSGGGDGQERTRWRSHQRVIENVRAKLVEAALPRQRPATPPVPADSAAPDRAAAATLPHVQPRDGRPWTPRPDGRVIPARLTALQWGNQAQFEYRAGRPDAALDAADNAAALDPEHPTRWPRLRRRIRGLPTVPAETPLLDNGDVDETTLEARRVGFQARVTAAWQVSDTDAILLLLAEAGVEQPRVELDRLRQGVRSSSHVAAIMARYDAHHAHNGPATEPPRRNVLAAGPRALNNRHELADHLRRATTAGKRLEEPHRQAIAGVIRWLEDRTQHARQVPEPFVPLEMDRHTVAAELRGLAAELDGRPEGAWMTSPAGGRLVADLAAMAERLDEGAGYAARGRFAEASRQARDSYFTQERRPALVEALRDTGSADPEADTAFVYQGDPRRQYQLDTATDRLTNILYRLNPDKPQGIVAESPHTATMAAAAQQDGAPPTNGGPAVPGGAATPAATTMALDGPMRLLVADTPPAGAQVAGAALTVTDQAALTAWLTAQRSVYQDARGGEERRLWRAAGRMLDQLQQPASGTDVDTATSSTAAAASHRGTPPTTGDGVHPAAVAASAVSRRVTPPPTSSGTSAVDGAVQAVPGSPTAGVHPTRPGRGSMR